MRFAFRLEYWRRNLMCHNSRQIRSVTEIVGVTGGHNVIRHTVRAFLAEAGVPDAEAVPSRVTRPKAARPASATSIGGRSICGVSLTSLKPCSGLWPSSSSNPSRDSNGPINRRRMVVFALAACQVRADPAHAPLLNLERETRLELATPTLARSCSTN